MKEKTAFWLLNPASKTESVLLALLFLFLPTQLGKHFWPSFTLVSGIRVDYLSPTIYFTDLLLISLFISCFFRYGIFGCWYVLKKHLLILIFLVLFLVSALFAFRLPLGIYWWAKIIEYTFLGLYLRNTLKYPYQLSLLAIILAISSYFESLLAIFQYLTQGSLNGWLYYLGERTFTGVTPGIANASINGALVLRPYGTFSHPNVLAAFLLFSSMFIGFFLVGKTKGIIRLFSVFVLLVNGIAIVLTLSRLVIALGFIFLISALFFFLFRIRSYRKSLLAALGIGGIFGVVFIPLLKTLLLRFSQSSFFEEAYVQRIELINHSLVLLQRHPVIGVGPGNFIPALAPLQSPFSPGMYLQPVHNIFLLTAVETGAVGLLLLLWLFVMTSLSLIRSIKTVDGYKKEYLFFSSMFACLLVLGMFDHYFLTIQQGQLLFTFLIGLFWMRLHAAQER